MRAASRFTLISQLRVDNRDFAVEVEAEALA
jgi:hypothetical protein